MVERMVSSNLSKYGLGKSESMVSISKNQPGSVKDTTMIDLKNDKNGHPRPVDDFASQKEPTMVERMVSSNLSKYGLGKSESMVSISKNQPGSVKDTTMINLKNEKNGHPRHVDDFASQKEETVTQPFQAKSLPGNNNVNNNLVYARRKADGELNSSRALDKNQTPGNQQAGDNKPSPQLGNEGVQSFARIPANSVATRIGSGNELSSMPGMEHWNTRFSQLQGYLQRCNTLNQEVYLQKFQSYSPDECNRHAVELERRANRLRVDEGKEIERVKALNVVGKSAGNHLLLPSLFKPENHV